MEIRVGFLDVLQVELFHLFFFFLVVRQLHAERSFSILPSLRQKGQSGSREAFIYSAGGVEDVAGDDEGHHDGEQQDGADVFQGVHGTASVSGSWSTRTISRP